MSRFARSRFAVAAVVALSVGLTACGSSGGGTTSSGSGGGSGGGGGKVNATIAAAVKKLTERPTSIGITDPIKGTIPGGKTIAFIQCGSPICASLGTELADAASQVKWKVQRINSGLTAESIKSAWGQAVSAKPDAVVTSGVPRVLYATELAQLKALNIPVLDLTSANETGNGLTHVYGDAPGYSQQGTNVADYMLAQAGGSGIKELSVTISAYPSVGIVHNGIKAELAKQCPSCSSSSIDVPATSIGSDLPTRVTSYLSSHPNVNWVYVGFSDMVTGLPAALSSAGLSKVKIVTLATNPTVATYIKQGKSVVMSTGFDIREMMWRSVDFLVRKWTNSSEAQNTSSATLPTWFVTKDNIPSTTEDFTYVAGYKQQYEKLWGVN